MNSRHQEKHLFETRVMHKRKFAIIIINNRIFGIGTPNNKNRNRITDITRKRMFKRWVGSTLLYSIVKET